MEFMNPKVLTRRSSTNQRLWNISLKETCLTETSVIQLALALKRVCHYKSCGRLVKQYRRKVLLKIYKSS